MALDDDMINLDFAHLQDARSAQGYWDSIIKENDEHENETFTYRLKLLKRNVRQAVRYAFMDRVGQMSLQKDLIAGSPCHW